MLKKYVGKSELVSVWHPERGAPLMGLWARRRLGATPPLVGVAAVPRRGPDLLPGDGGADVLVDGAADAAVHRVCLGHVRRHPRQKSCG